MAVKKRTKKKKSTTAQCTERLASAAIAILEDLILQLKSGCARKLTLEKGFLLALTRLRLGSLL